MTSLTQRSSGLVQRRTEASRNAADKERAAGGGGGGSGEDDAQSRRDEQDDDDKGDSKETRLTLMEEVLLLGLKDREVRAGRGRLARARRVPSEPPSPAPGSALQAWCTECLDYSFLLSHQLFNFDSQAVCLCSSPLSACLITRIEPRL